MKGYISLSDDIHRFRKTNNVSLKDGSDDYVCERCGIKGNRSPMSARLYVSRAKKELFERCDGTTLAKRAEDAKKPKRYRVKVKPMIDGMGDLKKGDIVTPCPPPEGFNNDRGIWVKKDKTILLFYSEVELVKEETQ